MKFGFDFAIENHPDVETVKKIVLEMGGSWEPASEKYVNPGFEAHIQNGDDWVHVFIDEDPTVDPLPYMVAASRSRAGALAENPAETISGIF